MMTAHHPRTARLRDKSQSHKTEFWKEHSIPALPVLAAEADVTLAFAIRHTFKVGRTKVGAGEEGGGGGVGWGGGVVWIVWASWTGCRRAGLVRDPWPNNFSVS